MAVLAAATAAGLAYMRVLHRHALVVAPSSLRQALPAPQPVRAVVLPRNLNLTRKRTRALPAPAKVIEPTRVLPTRPGAVNRTRNPHV